MAIVVTALDGVAEYARVTAARAFGSDTFVMAQIGARGQISRRELEEKLQRNPAVTRRDLRFLERLTAASSIRRQRAAHGRSQLRSRSYENAAVGRDGRQVHPRSGDRERAVLRAREEAQAAQVAVIGATLRRRCSQIAIRWARRFCCWPGSGGACRSGWQRRRHLARSQRLIRFARWTFGSPQTLQVLARASQDTGSVGCATLAAEDRARVSMRARRQLAPDADDNFDILTPDAARGFVLNLSQRIGLAAGSISLMALLAAIVVVTNTIPVGDAATREIGAARSGRRRGRCWAKCSPSRRSSPSPAAQLASPASGCSSGDCRHHRIRSDASTSTVLFSLPRLREGRRPGGIRPGARRRSTSPRRYEQNRHQRTRNEHGIDTE
jgi:hypothetical protein